jgi:hypothetical protein
MDAFSLHVEFGVEGRVCIVTMRQYHPSYFAGVRSHLQAVLIEFAFSCASLASIFASSDMAFIMTAPRRWLNQRNQGSLF